MPVKIFFCYAHEDELLLNKLKAHLKPLQRKGLIDFWYDRDISAGSAWEQQIKEHLNAAQIILLLVSSDFMDSDYCYGIEMQRALERDKKGEARVIPIILRPVDWQDVLGNLQALPTDAKPIMSSSWQYPDEAFFNVTEGIRKIIKNLAPQPSTPPPTPPVSSSLQNQVSSSPSINSVKFIRLKQYQFFLFLGTGTVILAGVILFIFQTTSLLPVVMYPFTITLLLVVSIIVGYIAGFIFDQRSKGLFVGTIAGIVVGIGNLTIYLIYAYVFSSISFFDAPYQIKMYLVVDLCCGLLGLLGAWLAKRITFQIR